MDSAELHYVLFRHKWKLLTCTVAGFVASAVVFVVQKPAYTSEAKLLIRYVLETRSVGPANPDAQVKSPDSGGDSILNSEMQILSSMDLAREVALAVGPSNLVGTLKEGDPLTAAAFKIRSQLSFAVPPRSSIIVAQFSDQDPRVARAVLTNLVAGYLKMHARVHRSMDIIEDLERQTDQQRSVLEQTESELRRVKGELGVTSLIESQKARAEQLNQLEVAVLGIESLLAEAKAGLIEPITNATPGKVEVPEASAEQVSAYRRVLNKIELLIRREQELSLQFTDENSLIRSVREQLKTSNEERQRLETLNPAIAKVTLPAPKVIDGAVAPGYDLRHDLARIRGLEAKHNTLTNRVAELRSAIVEMDRREAEITQLQRKRELDEKRYFYYSSSLEQARVDQTLGPSRMANINIIQAPTAALPNLKKVLQLVGGAIAGGIGLGLAIAFFLELYADQSIRRPKQVEQTLKLPLFSTIPRLGLAPHSASRLLTNSNGDTPALDKSTDDNNSGAESLSLHAESLRDRLIMDFQVKGLLHKPKLIGVTSCGSGAGVTTIATSLAASLSETGEGNVLYVDVNQKSGPSVHPFHKGSQVAGISNALDAGTKDTTLVSENLYMVSLTEPGAGRVGVLPKRLASLVPQIKASNYDYIIFDLPPVTQTSATARVSGLLDMTVVVLESGKTHGDIARQALAMLSESRTQMVGVLNKHRRYLPEKLDGDL